MPRDSVHVSLGASAVLRIAALALSSSFAARLPAAEVLVESGSNWLFFRGRSQPSEPDATSWRNRRFCDSAWESGKAGIGYGDDATVLQDMQNGYLTVYLRKRFQVADPAGISSLLLTVRFDDGFVAFLNGRELGRANLPAGAVGASTVAAVSVGDAPATCEVDDRAAGCAVITVPVGFLADGLNVFAFSVHNAGLASSDLSFIPTLDARLKGEVFERFRRGDVGQDERIDISDALGILGFLFLGRSAPKCLKSADTNDDAEVDLADAIYLLFSLFVTGGDLPEPAACGLDPTDDGLSCFSYAPCAPSL